MSMGFSETKRVITNFDTLDEALDALRCANQVGNRFCKKNQTFDFDCSLEIGADSYNVILTILKED